MGSMRRTKGMIGGMVDGEPQRGDEPRPEEEPTGAPPKAPGQDAEERRERRAFVAFNRWYILLMLLAFVIANIWWLFMVFR